MQTEITVVEKHKQNKNNSREGSCEKYSHVNFEQEWASAREGTIQRPCDIRAVASIAWFLFFSSHGSLSVTISDMLLRYQNRF